MEISEFIQMLESIAPSELALDFDNVGLIIGTTRNIHKVLVALDCSVAVAREAVSIGADLVLTHHPLFFHGIKRILPDDPDTSAAYILIQNGIGLYSSHTNLDAAPGGVNDTLAEILGAQSVLPFTKDGIGRIGLFSPAISMKELLHRCQNMLHCKPMYHGNTDTMIHKAWIVSGSGSGSFYNAVDSGCDVFVTGELKHHEALSFAEYGIPYIICGHYQSETIMLKKWISRLQRFESDVQYYLTISEKPLFSIYEEDIKCPDRN